MGKSCHSVQRYLTCTGCVPIFKHNEGFKVRIGSTVAKEDYGVLALTGAEALIEVSATLLGLLNND